MTVGALPPAGPAAMAAPAVVPPPGLPASVAAARAAVSFEGVLLEHLTTQLAATAVPDDEEGSAGTSAYRDLLPRAMADSLAAAGGLGIAAALAPASTTGTIPGTAATASVGPSTAPAPPTPTGSPS